VGYEEGVNYQRLFAAALLGLVARRSGKAHPDVFNILLQVLDDGRITDSQGRTVDFRNTVIVMTSNIGSEHILDLSGDNEQYERMHKRVLDGLRSHFRPEFLNRVDDIILFHTLSRSELRQIISIQIKRVQNLLADQKFLWSYHQLPKITWWR
jgi:ATP-dependent Clp protease ATP-binding subunit ClpB